MNIRVQVEIGQQATTYEDAELLLAVLKEELKTSKIGKFEAELMMFGGIVDIL